MSIWSIKQLLDTQMTHGHHCRRCNVHRIDLKGNDSCCSLTGDKYRQFIAIVGVLPPESKNQFRYTDALLSVCHKHHSTTTEVKTTAPEPPPAIAWRTDLGPRAPDFKTDRTLGLGMMFDGARVREMMEDLYS